MDTTKSHGFFLANFLVLMFLGDLIEACSTCPETSLRDACCRHDFVMRLLFVSVKRDPEFPIHLNIFTIQPIRVFKGPMYLRNTRMIISPEDEDYCGYRHRGPFRRDDYLISGRIDDIGPQINKCHLAIPWSEVSLADKMNLDGVAGKNCRTICAHN